MDRFTADWLALRESADGAARSAHLTSVVAAGLPADRIVHVLDLATGTGSNMRFLSEHLPSRQEWLLVDRDPALLFAVAGLTRPWATGRDYETDAKGDHIVLRSPQRTCRFRTRAVDLAPMTDASLFTGRELVTASALLDLVSERWLRRLVAHCREARARVLFALTYDGRLECLPEEPEDAAVRELINQHQRTDKGFGPALGPDAADCAEELFGAAGYEVRRETSDWVLSSESKELQSRLVEGWARAACECAPERSAAIHAWEIRRLGHIENGRSRIVVGHADLAAWLPA